MTNETVSTPTARVCGIVLIDVRGSQYCAKKKPYFARVTEQQQLHGKGTISEVSSDWKLRVSLE